MIWDTARPADTAEWQCTQCSTTNRRLVTPGATTADDRCLHCRLRHTIDRGPTPVRWTARAR
ncbi:MAG: hypothetical protein SFU57_10875 [Gemmatimonadales bacterium]|nr:hypothetical protein [Gemmatimonadales bacterium]MDZ4258244.1 hypothetical protein [Gemmatimonadales bacterium]MDZ4390730.1 hypothetical protein [Gemmatimonadales bacterium]